MVGMAHMDGIVRRYTDPNWKELNYVQCSNNDSGLACLFPNMFFSHLSSPTAPQKHLGKSGPVTGQEDSPWKAPKPRSSGQARSCFGEVVGKTEGWVRENGGFNMIEPFYGDSLVGLLFFGF